MIFYIVQSKPTLFHKTGCGHGRLKLIKMYKDLGGRVRCVGLGGSVCVWVGVGGGGGPKSNMIHTWIWSQHLGHWCSPG